MIWEVMEGASRRVTLAGPYLMVLLRVINVEQSMAPFLLRMTSLISPDIEWNSGHTRHLGVLVAASDCAII